MLLDSSPAGARLIDGKLSLEYLAFRRKGSVISARNFYEFGAEICRVLFPARFAKKFMYIVVVVTYGACYLDVNCH
ncbi:hypothetical protein SDJN02_23901 [Cucurbita argyrosperma subsp. argyrosperma]|nr:hypothetical protein SDJN02_23901 [Cucurbita argyrosperma subsp. argyrosperma]